MAKDVITRIKVENAQANRNIKQTSGMLDQLGMSGKQSGAAIGQLDKILGTSIGTLGKLSLATAAVIGAMKVMKDAFFQSESNIDAWGSAMQQSDAAYKTFLNTLNSGSWSNFFTNLTEAINGAADLYEKLDRLGSIKQNNAAAIAIKEASLAELRVRKQKGENVDAKIKQLTDEIAALKKEATDAGKVAGRAQIDTELRNRVNAEGGARVLDKDIQNARRRYLTEGQSYVDEQASVYNRLQKKGTVKGVTSFGNYGYGQTVETEEFDIKNLSVAEQRAYALAKAIVEGEASIATGAATVAGAYQEAAANAKQEFKNNKIAGVGSGSGSGSSKTFTSSMKEGGMFDAVGTGGTTTSMAELKKQLAEAQTALSKATDNFVAADLEKVIADIQSRINAQPTALRLGISEETVASIDDQLVTLGEHITEKLEEIKPVLKIDVEEQGKKVIKTADAMASSWRTAASCISQVSGALSNIESPAMNIVTALATAIATIGVAYAETLAKDQTSKSNIWSFIAAAAAATISLATTVASVKKSMSGFAEGGIVGGANFSGDVMNARINSGEMVINQSDQARLYDAIHSGAIGGNGGGGNSTISGEQIVTVINAYGRRTGRGEILR